MRNTLWLVMCIGCIPVGRQTTEGSLTLGLDDREPAWFGHEVTLATARVTVGQLVLREPVDGDWGNEEFDDRFGAPHIEGVAMGSWDDTVEVDLLDPRAAYLGNVQLHDGRPRTAGFRLGGPLVLRGSLNRFGVTVPFDLTLELDEEVRNLPTLDNRVAPAGGDVGWRLDLTRVLQGLDWTPSGKGALSVEEPGVAIDLIFGLTDAASWRVELR